MFRKLVALGLMTVSVGPVRAGDGAGCKALFGRDAHPGRAQCGPGEFTLENGVATAAGGLVLGWFTNRRFAKFVRRGEFKPEQPSADAGVFVRFRHLRVKGFP